MVLRNLILDRRAGVEGIRIVLLQREFRRNHCNLGDRECRRSILIDKALSANVQTCLPALHLEADDSNITGGQRCHARHCDGKLTIGDLVQHRPVFRQIRRNALNRSSRLIDLQRKLHRCDTDCICKLHREGNNFSIGLRLAPENAAGGCRLA